MRIAILGDGTRGDVWPLAALGAHLTSRGHAVTMTASEEFRPMAEAAGTRFVALPVSLPAYIASDEGQRLLNRAKVPLMWGMQRFAHAHREGIEGALIEAADGAEALISGPLCRERAYCLAAARGLPHAIAHPFPVVPTGEFPFLLTTNRRVPTAFLRRATYNVGGHIWWRIGLRDYRAFARRLGLSSLPGSIFDLYEDPEVLMLHAFSPSLVPRPHDWGGNHAVTGFWRLPGVVRDALGEGVPGDLAEWLDAGEPPVFLGFGSMPVLDAERFLTMAMEATHSLGVRAVVNAPWVGRDGTAHHPPAHVRMVGAVDHERLLPRCVAAVHHGGAGTVAASLRAALPTMVCSVWVDQPFWGQRLERLGVGAHVPFKRLDRSKLEAGLRTLLSVPVGERAAALGEAIRAEGDGTERAARLVDDWLAAACRGIGVRDAEASRRRRRQR
jgi:sterol 3beta-glucosyltransferase